jgi:hypothetical protein
MTTEILDEAGENQDKRLTPGYNAEDTVMPRARTYEG